MKIFNKKNFKKALSFMMCVLFTVLAATSFPKASAQESLDDLKKQYNNLDKEIAENEKKLAKTESDIKANEKKLQTISGQIDSIKSQIEILDQRIKILDGSISELRPQINELGSQIDDVTKNIKELDKQIDDAQKLAADTQDALLARIREDYMAGGNASMVEILLTSEDLSTFLARMELMDRVSENDQKLIDELEERSKELGDLKDQANHQKADLEVKKGVLDSKMSELNANQNDLEYSRSSAASKSASLDSKQKQVNELLNELDEDSEEYKKELARQRAEKAALAKQIDNYVAQNGSAKGDEVPEEYLIKRTSANLIWPVPYSNTAISCHYGRYSDGSPHTGTDIVVRDANGNNISNGKSIVAAQSGKVIMCHNDGGYNGGYGNYCVIDHGDGMLTAYAHCKYLTVSNGQIVSQGQQIGAIGLTGNTTGYHLHFEVRIKNADGSVSRVNPESYVHP